MRAALIAGLLALAVADAALAGQPVSLRGDVADENGSVTLADLFDDAGAAGAVVVAAARPGSGLVLDAARVQMLARAHGLDWDNPTGISRIIVRAGVAASTASAAPRPGRSERVLAYAHDLNAGDIIRPQDLIWSREAVAGGDAPHDAEAVIGMAARRPLREGTAVMLHDVSAPQVIKAGDMVAVSFTAGGISLTLQAKALQSATTGQLLNVINPNSNKVIEAVAAGPGQALVGPQADVLKAARNNPALIAALR